MATERLKDLLKPNQTIEKEGIFVAKEIAEKTVWDKLAIDDPTHAVISARDEKTAVKKSQDQIEDIRHHLVPNQVLLDCGSGYGRVAKYLLPNIQLGGYIGVDSSYGMLAIFKARYEQSLEEKKTPLLLVNADIHTLPINDSSVDVIVVSAVFLHNHKSIVEKAMMEIKRVVKPGGKVLIYSSFPRSATFMGLQGLIYQALLNLLGKPFKNGPVRYYRRKQILHMFDNFTEVELRPSGYSVLPKTLIFLPKPLEIVWRKGIANPINSLLEKITPAKIRPFLAVHYDVMAVK